VSWILLGQFVIRVMVSLLSESWSILGQFVMSHGLVLVVLLLIVLCDAQTFWLVCCQVLYLTLVLSKTRQLVVQISSFYWLNDLQWSAEM
jgi:hypothetical protein